jgi:hypothetical protein
MMRLCCCICFLLLFSINLNAQQDKAWEGFGIEANFMGGKVLKHTVNFRAPVPDFSSAFELNFVQQTYGKNDWEQRRHYPLVGVGLTFTNYGIDSIYGKCISIYPNLQLPIIKGKNIEWTLRAGFGLGYVTRHYERTPVFDTLNNAIGSHFNNYSFFATDLRLHLDTHVDLQVGANFSHISNAALRTPNLGVNLYGAHIGFRYFPVASRPENIHRKFSPLKNRWLAQIRLGIAANEYGQANGPLYPVYLVSVFASKRYLSKNKLLIGVDYSYHEGIYAFLKNNEIHPGEEGKYSWKSSIFAGNEFLLGRFGILLQVGYYIKEASLKLDPYYEKLGCNIYLIQREKGFLKELSTSVLLKTHKTQAELVEIGLGAGF